MYRSVLMYALEFALILVYICVKVCTCECVRMRDCTYASSHICACLIDCVNFKICVRLHNAFKYDREREGR